MSEETGATAPKPVVSKRQKWAPPELTQEKLDELEARYEDLLVMRGDPDMSPWMLVLRRPTRPETLLWKSNSKKTDGHQSVIANEILIRTTAVFPEPHVIDVQFQKWALLADGLVNNERYRAFIGVATEADLKG